MLDETPRIKLQGFPDDKPAPKKRGRPKGVKNGEGKRASKPVRNITLDADLLDKLHTCQAALAKQLGFTPTLSQTLRYVIGQAYEVDALSV